MKNQLKHHLIAYTILIILLVILSALYMRVWPNRLLMRVMSLVFGGVYFFWGVIAHVKTKRISVRVVYEYATVSLLVSLALLLVTF